VSLTNAKAFFDRLREGLLGPALDPGEVAGCESILAACEGLGVAQTAYCLATSYHETAHTMMPIKEMGGATYFTRMYDPAGQRPDVAARLGNTMPGDGARFAGRGYVQLTGRANYLKAGQKIGMGQDLIETPDLAMRQDIAARIMRAGMAEGWFTGKSLDSFLPANGKPATMAQFINARRIINGTDRAELIAGYAVQFDVALRAGGWQ